MEGMCCMIGRKEERDYLLSLINEDEPQFVAVFGRRRIGKTYQSPICRDVWRSNQ